MTYLPYWSIPGVTPLHARAMAASVHLPIARMHRRQPFDVMLASWAYPDGVAAAILAERLGFPLVTLVQGSDINEHAQNPALRPAIAWGLARAGRVVAVSRALRDKVVALGVPAERVIVQHNGVDGRSFGIKDRFEARRTLGMDVTGRLIVYVGNLVREKGVDLLPEALAHLQRDGATDAHLAIVGHGVLQAEMRAAASRLGILDRIRFVGRRPHAEIPDWIAAGDVLVLPSRREGCPNVVLEALASGRPVAATDVGGIPELLPEGTGVLAQPDNARDLGRALRDTLARTWDPARQRAAVRSLSWHDYGRTLREALDSVIREKTASTRAQSAAAGELGTMS